jgi:signal transduction histidine kinase
MQAQAASAPRAMNPTVEAADAAQAPLRALASLLPCGVVVLAPDGAASFASARACALLGVADEAGLRARWPELSFALGLSASALPRGARPLLAAGTIDAEDGSRAIRVEVHPTGASSGRAWIALVERRDRADDFDAMLIAASRWEASRHVLSGRLHDLNGPLNNLTLTLALLSAALPPMAAQPTDDVALQRCRRYADTLALEARRLAEGARAISAAIVPAEPSAGVAPVSTLLRDAQHTLRHHASMHEVRVSVDTKPAADFASSGDLDLLQLALVGLLLTALAATDPGGEIMVTPADAGGGLLLTRARVAREPVDGAAAASGLMLVSPRAQWLCYAAARRILELHGGGATLHAEPDTLLIEARMPIAHA